jgi:D-galactarolactone cycloisomerase
VKFPLVLGSVRAQVFRAPLEMPVVTSFGVMRDRPMVMVRAEDQEGAVGWGEIWCNFPSVGAEHRARLVDAVLAPLIVGKPFDSPRAVFELMTAGTEVLALQSAEPGPFAQAIAGIDIALWDLVARRAARPLWQILGGASPRVRVYASGINPTNPEAVASAKYDEGYRAFKLKIGFGANRDVANLKALRQVVGGAVEIMVDANQGWAVEEAIEMVPKLEPFGLTWLEEPLRVDAPWPEWRQLERRTFIPLAAGENLAGDAAFDAALGQKTLRVLQPDIAKWGGFSGCLPLAQRILAEGIRFCPHYLGGGIGLLASAHLLAGVGGDGLLEVDANPNPLRSRLCAPLTNVSDSAVVLSDEPGLGVDPDLDTLADFAVTH